MTFLLVEQAFFATLWLVVSMVSACASASGHRLGIGPERPKVERDDVVVYRTFDQVPGPFEEVAIIAGTGNQFASEGNVMDAMKSKAGKLGANGIVIAPGESTVTRTGGLWEARGLKGEAVAIYVYPGGEQEVDGGDE